MAGTDDEPTDDAARDAPRPGRMLVREWVIAANYYAPGDYDVPQAPRFRAERREDGALVLYAPDTDEHVLTAGAPSPVRR
ncbi:hypothetical protein [Halomarina ordinaria]|uniref:Uncharacterized protein n=1 Tax=Halomarina ordinaria TaxID=3033939 RepID=A0ABD5U8I8_9EURY|nr:hypothetical protein [Halomarina sp. PSRA2]